MPSDDTKSPVSNIEKESISAEPKRESIPVRRVETVQRPENEPVKIESLRESQEQKIQPQENQEGEVGVVTPTGVMTQAKKEREKKIENILSQGLEDEYMKMLPDTQREFRTEGERTAREINNLLDKAKIKIKQVIDLIRKWLSLIPGVNKFFLEQEAKIKADEILKLKE